MTRAYLAILSLAIGGTMLGCTPEGRSDMSQGAERMGEGIKKDAQVTGKVLKEQGDRAAEEMKPIMRDAGQKFDAATMTAKVKNVLNETKDIDSSKIDVDTMDGTIHLKGSVPDEKQKAEAATLAQGVAGKDYKVSNELTTATK